MFLHFTLSKEYTLKIVQYLFTDLAVHAENYYKNKTNLKSDYFFHSFSAAWDRFLKFFDDAWALNRQYCGNPNAKPFYDSLTDDLLPA